ncbi:hypothetical protein MMC13_001991 [Lambiella insularis]|nr:hypothetical protein [Lambiella insularis]
MVQTVIIVGAGWAGLPLAHKLLKYTLPKAKDGLKVILISPNSHFYWNVAATRGVIPGAIPDEQLFLPIEHGFSRYSAENFEFVLGKVERLEPERNIVEVAKTDKTQCALSYDQLVIATGSQIRSNLPFKSVGTHQETLAALHSLQKQIGLAKSIVVAGAGPTGVETAGEMAAAYGQEKDITLIIGAERVLQASNVLPSVSQVVEKDLQKLSVKLLHNTQVKHVQTAKQGKQDVTAQTTLTLSNGSTLVADLYLPLFGVQVNTSFVPANLLDSQGNMILDKTMRATGAKNIWGIGDVGNVEVKEYKPSGKPMVFITMGKKYATGQIGEWKLWGMLVAYVKGRKLFTDTAPGYVAGKNLRHASM